MDSGYYLNMVNKYKDVKSKLEGSLTYFEGSCDSLNKSISYMEKLLIDNEPIDKGKLKEESIRLTKVNENLKSLIIECNNKISGYSALYNKTLAEEKGETVADKDVTVMNRKINLNNKG